MKLGGDDCRMNIWDVRINEEGTYGSSKMQSISRNAGVTSFLNHKENMLLVGSYDEHLCLYDLRNLKRSIDEINLNGGIWRIKQSPIDNDILLVACMYQNFSIVECSTSQGLKCIGEYNEHKSICYGCDWSYHSDDEFQFFATCSFYDHRLSLCRFKKSIK